MNDTNKYSPYWVLNPLKNNINVRSHKKWSFFSTKEVKAGISPLENLGEEFYQMAHNHVSLYDHCLWIFNNDEFNNEDFIRIGMILKSISETYCNSFLSQSGTIIKFKNGEITKQPLMPKYVESISGENLTDRKLIRIINITESIYENNLMGYLSIFTYLSEIKKSSMFIKELALWSFLEQHWLVNEKSNNKLAESLKNLGSKVYESKNPEYSSFKNKLKRLIESTGGKKKNLADLRNFLAHGTFYKQKENWEENQWELFSTIHKFLFEMVIQGLEREIMVV